jgi:DNA invertase Pin-like site-specific DNA recombinase
MGVTRELEEEVRRVLDALDQIEAMEDPVAQARAVAQLLKDQPTRNKRLKQLRDETVRQLRAEGMSFRKIAAEVQVSLGTVQDILRGHTGTWSSRPRKKETADTDDGDSE